MATPIEHKVTFTAPLERVHAAFTNEQYWDDRIEAVGGAGGRIDEFTVTDAAVDVKMVQTVAAENLPGLITKIHPGDLEIDRTQTWGPLDPAGNGAAGTFSAAIPGVPAKIGGTVTLTADGANSVMSVAGEVSVKIPLIGGKAESVAVEQLTRLLDKEDEFTTEWIAQHP